MCDSHSERGEGLCCQGKRGRKAAGCSAMALGAQPPQGDPRKRAPPGRGRAGASAASAPPPLSRPDRGSERLRLRLRGAAPTRGAAGVPCVAGGLPSLRAHGGARDAKLGVFREKQKFMDHAGEVTERPDHRRRKTRAEKWRHDFADEEASPSGASSDAAGGERTLGFRGERRTDGGSREPGRGGSPPLRERPPGPTTSLRFSRPSFLHRCQ